MHSICRAVRIYDSHTTSFLLNVVSFNQLRLSSSPLYRNRHPFESGHFSDGIPIYFEQSLPHANVSHASKHATIQQIPIRRSTTQISYEINCQNGETV